MADSIRGKQIKNKSEAIDEGLDNNLEITASEFEKQDEKSDRADSLELNQEELMAPQACDSLDDLLEFDAQVLASHSAEETDIESDNDLSESIENQYSEESNEESSLDVNNGPEETSETVKEIKQILNKAIDESSEYDFEQQDSYNDSAIIKAQNEKLSQFESELSEFKKILDAQQLDVDKRLEESSKKLKTISIFALIIAIFALLVSLLGGALNSAKQVEATESQSLVIDVKKDSAIPATLKIDNLQSQPIALTAEGIKPEKTLILPEDDISESSIASNIVITAVDKTPIKGWVVNLNSYEQLWEADKKIDELKKKNITTDMIIVNVKGIRWYRIRVTGFKTQSEADSYAATIKEILNVNHAWVSKM